MPHSYDYDAIVIGSGPGGEGAAMGLVKQGARVAVIERYHNVGGGCTHWGTIPSKALRHAVSRIIEFNQNPLYSDHSRLLRSSFADILNHADTVINQQTRMRQGFYERNHCEILQGNAHFVDEHTLALECHDGSVETLTAEKFVIACGSRPYHPADVDFSHPRIYDSDSILSLHHEPRHVIIYGAGVIGCEYASIFRGMEVKVDLINTRDRLLAFLDQEMSDSLSYHFWNSGVVIRHNEEYEKIEGEALLAAGLDTAIIDDRQPRSAQGQQHVPDCAAARLRGRRRDWLPKPGLRRLRSGPHRRTGAGER